jgi:hypothetical protein
MTATAATNCHQAVTITHCPPVPFAYSVTTSAAAVPAAVSRRQPAAAVMASSAQTNTEIMSAGLNANVPISNAWGWAADTASRTGPRNVTAAPASCQAGSRPALAMPRSDVLMPPATRLHDSPGSGQRCPGRALDIATATISSAFAAR